jgi:hypothetical protein
MYKKLVVFMIVFAVFCVNLFSQETTEDVKRFFTGGGITFSPNVDGAGHGEFSFLLYHNKLDIRNHILLRGTGLVIDNVNYGLLTLSEKISLGGIISNNRFRSYTFLEGGIGFFGNNDKKFFSTPLAYSFGAGGGTDIFMGKNGSVYLEAGYLGHILGSKYIGRPMFQIGWRGYF